jgi:hypothetical protein
MMHKFYWKLRCIRAKALHRKRPQALFKRKKNNFMKRAQRKKAKVVLVESPPRLLEAQLVARYGFHCCHDLRCFAKSLGPVFEAWCLEHIVENVMILVSIHSIIQDENSQMVVAPRSVFCYSVMRDRPRTWFHLPHFRLANLSVRCIHLLPLALIPMKSPIMSIFAQFRLIDAGKVCEDTVDGDKRYHVNMVSKGDEEFLFVVSMNVKK